MTTQPTAGQEGLRPLSPITRRIFLMVSTAAAGAAALPGCGGAGYADCIYCDAPGQDYEECDSDYCNYFDEQ